MRAAYKPTKLRGGLFAAGLVTAAALADLLVIPGTSWHRAFEHVAFRRAFLRHVAQARGRSFEPGVRSFAAARERRLDVLGDLVQDHLGTERLTRLIEAGVPAGLPTVQTKVRPCCAS